MDDHVAEAVTKFIAAVESRIAKQDARIETQLTEIRSLRAELETRAAPVIQPPEPIDVEAIATRAAALVPVPVAKDGEPGKDAVVDYVKIVEDTRAILGPMVTAEVAKIPAPIVDTDALARSAAALIPQPKDGEDGIATREELEALVRSEVGAVQVRNLADSWQGVWKPATTYARGSVVQWDGSPWLVLKDTANKPGESPDFTLFAKKGRDARR
jgi:hypothetical protein